MSAPAAKQGALEGRRAQMFPALTAPGIERIRRFGTLCAYADGETV